MEARWEGSLRLDWSLISSRSHLDALGFSSKLWKECLLQQEEQEGHTVGPVVGAWDPIEGYSWDIKSVLGG